MEDYYTRVSNQDRPRTRERPPEPTGPPTKDEIDILRSEGRDRLGYTQPSPQPRGDRIRE